jgi:hypothetical protein
MVEVVACMWDIIISCLALSLHRSVAGSSVAGSSVASSVASSSVARRSQRKEKGSGGKGSGGKEMEGVLGVRKPQRVSKPSAKARENLADKAVKEKEEREGEERGEGEDQEKPGEKVEDHLRLGVYWLCM